MCLRGASAVETILQNHAHNSVAVFVVWEPILPTDWSAPSTNALQRLNDRRVRQFWDTNHIVATALKKTEEIGQLHPNCCERKGFLWDLAAAYAPGTQWRETLPQPVLFDGPVVRTTPELDSALSENKSTH